MSIMLAINNITPINRTFVTYITAIWQTDENVSLENMPVLGNCQSYEKSVFSKK